MATLGCCGVTLYVVPTQSISGSTGRIDIFEAKFGADRQVFEPSDVTLDTTGAD